MSNSLAIAAVTSALRLLLDTAATGVPGLSVTTKHPDRARVGESGNQLNVFLYHLGPDAAWRNAELPNDRTGASGFFPPVALTLEYLVTAYAPEDDDLEAQKLLGRAVSILHDAAVLDRVLLENALVGSDVHLQPDRVRLTPTHLSIEDASKLWTSFVSNYRLSVAYTASVVLIESTISRPAPLPVLRRGEDGRGVLSRVGVGASVIRAYPDIGPTDVVVNARLGNQIVLEGTGLSARHRVRFSHPLRADIELEPLPDASETQLRVELPAVDAPNARREWAAGLYSVAVVQDDPSGRPLPSNGVPLALSTTIMVPARDHPAGDVELSILCSPRLDAKQTVVVLFGRRQVEPDTIATDEQSDDPSEVTVTSPSVTPGEYVIRLRVDGVDSLPVTMTGPGESPPATFDDDQRVVVT